MTTIFQDILLIVDFNSQYTQLIARRVREVIVNSKIFLHNFYFK